MAAPCTLSDRMTWTSLLKPHAAQKALPLQGDLARIVSEKILDGLELNDDSHTLLRENIACYLFNLAGKEKLEELSRKRAVSVDEVLPFDRSGRWGGKLKRDLGSPYTDTEVFQHVRELDSDLRQKLTFILSHTRGFPTKVYLTGSFVKARLGKNSDLDLHADVDPKTRDLILNDYYKNGKEDGARIFPLFGNRFYRGYFTRVWGKRMDLGSGEEFLRGRDFLVKKYCEILEKKGFEVSQGDGKLRVKAPSHMERTREQSISVELMLQECKDINARYREHPGVALFLAKEAEMVAGTIAGALLMCPFIGSYFDRFLSRIVPG